MRQQHFIQIGIFEKINFRFLTYCFNQLFHFISQLSVKMFIKKSSSKELEKSLNKLAKTISLTAYSCFVSAATFEKSRLEQFRKALFICPV